MSDLAIRVENLSKQYTITTAKHRHDTLRDQLMHGLKSVFRWNGQPRRAEETIWALKDVSFEVKQGEVVGIIGRNGAGKSTLLKILSRITEPTAGRAEIYGRVGSLLEVGTGFDRELSGRENIYLNGAILGMRKVEIDRKFDEIVAFSEVEKFINTPVKHYSSGMYVRLAFAVAAHLEPEILIVDEVLAVGDAAFQKKCLGKMGAVAKEGRTVLFVSHNMQAISSLCDWGVLIEQGRILGVGESSQVVSKYIKEVGSAFHTPREQAWDDTKTAPGNDRIRLHRIRQVAETDDPTQEIRVDTPIRLEIEYWNIVPQTHIIVELCLYSIDGVGVFEDLTTREAHWHGRGFPKGLFRTVCQIPAHLLNSGTYRFRIVFVDEFAAHLYDHQEAVVFSVHDVRDTGIPWYGRFMGYVRPRLNWTTEMILEDRS